MADTSNSRTLSLGTRSQQMLTNDPSALKVTNHFKLSSFRHGHFSAVIGECMQRAHTNDDG